VLKVAKDVGVWLQPADLGFDAAVIAGAGNLNGLVIPWAASYRFRRMNFWLRLTGAVINASLRLNQELDFDGVTVLRSGLTGFWNNATASGAMCASASLVTSLASVGAVTAAVLPMLWGAPYLQFNVLNNDALNAVTVTLRVGLFE
jgi:hypothetical protein